MPGGKFLHTTVVSEEPRKFSGDGSLTFFADGMKSLTNVYIQL